MEYLFYAKECTNLVANYHALCVVPELGAMTEEEAIELSIQKWESIIYLTERGFKIRADGGPSTCGLCALFYHDVHCHGCPIYEETGLKGCVSTPHEDWEIAVGIHCNSGLAQAREEVEFLESLKG